jgi:hypothetical protein
VQVLDTNETIVKEVNLGDKIAGFTLENVGIAKTTFSISSIKGVHTESSGKTSVYLDNGEAVSFAAVVKTIKFGDGEINFSGASSPAKVVMLYEGLLGRSVEKDGLNFWNDQIEKPEDCVIIARNIMNSEEFRLRSGSMTDVEFIKYLYDGILGRQADEGGFNTHLDSLQNGMTREVLANIFVQSQEATQNFEDKNTGGVWTTNKNSRDISMIYDTILNRNVDESGIDFWNATLDKGFTLSHIVKSLIDSDEFSGKYGKISDKDFIALMYSNSFERASDEQGMTFWSDKLSKQEISWEDLALRFATSAEHIAQFEHRPEADVFGF